MERGGAMERVRKAAAEASGGESETNVSFGLSEQGGVAWWYNAKRRELTLAEAQAIGNIRGLHAIANSIDRLADAVEDLASAVREHGQGEDA